MRFLVVFLVFLLSANVEAKDLQIYFSPSSVCENKVVEYIDKSKKRIDVAVYAINNDEIVKALKRAHDRGVKIRILTDRLQASNKNSKVRELYKYGINIRVHSKFKIEHNKFAIYDDEVVSGGSFNWTNPATHKNSENCLFFIENDEALEEYQSRFAYLWRINTKKKSDEWFRERVS